MCQATVYLDGKEIMHDVTSVEILSTGVRLSAFFETPLVIEATIRHIDLLKHRVILESIEKGEGDHERGGETASSDTSLDGT